MVKPAPSRKVDGSQSYRADGPQVLRLHRVSGLRREESHPSAPTGQGVEPLAPVSVDAVLSQAAEPNGSMADSLVRGLEASGLIDFVSGDVLSGAEAQAAFAELGSDALYEYCFAAGTLVLMADGTAKRIEEIEPGEMVLSVPDREVVATLGRRDLVTSVPGSAWEQTGGETLRLCPTPQPRPVVEIYHNAPARLLNLHIGDEVIRSTFGHPFLVRGRGWVRAEDLAIGDQLRSHRGDWLAISDVVDSGRIELVYNLQVDEDHTYFVAIRGSDGSVLVHNRSPGDEQSGPPDFDPSLLQQGLLLQQDLAREQGSIYEEVFGNSLPSIEMSQTTDDLSLGVPAADPRWEALSLSDLAGLDVQRGGVGGTSSVASYLGDAATMTFVGDYGEADVNAIGVAGSVAFGITGLDVYKDVADIGYGIHHWEWSWGHAGVMGLNIVAVVPVIGAVKNLKYFKNLRHADNLKHIDNLKHVDDAAKSIGNVGDASKAAAKGIGPDDMIPDGISFDIVNPKYRQFKNGDNILEYTLQGGEITVDWVSGKNASSMMKSILDAEGAGVTRVSGYATDKLGGASTEALQRLSNQIAGQIGGGWKAAIEMIEGRRYLVFTK